MKLQLPAVIIVLFFACFGAWFLGLSMGDKWGKDTAAAEFAADVAANADALNALSDRVIYLQEACSFIGRVSWYGDREAGQRTANGERFNPGELSAASLFLRFHSRWQVTRLDTGASVTVRINDRIPGRHGRVLDLSREAARRLGMLERGVVRVRVEPGL
jgi:rare lipoprotein A (peptidoglycan hydrolase)